MNGIIAILTDFGNQDAYPAIMKGVILSINREAIIIDVTHQVKPYSIVSASYLLYTAWDYYPEGTTFLAVIDPGVGSSRGILIATDKPRSKVLVTPDNGIVSMLVRMKKLENFYRPSEETMKSIKQLIPNTSSTFHGRDIFSPLTALISKNGIEEIVGEEISPQILADLSPTISVENSVEGNPVTTLIKGKILHIDNFGNCISSIHKNDMLTAKKILGLQAKIETNLPTTPIDIQVGKIHLHKLSDYFSQADIGSALAYIGSSGFLEIAINQGNAASTLDIEIGDEVNVRNKIPT